LAIVAAVPMKGVTHLFGTLATREQQGAIMLAALVVVMTAAAAVHGRVVGSAPSGAVRLPRGAPWLALALICAGLALAIAVGAKETTRAPSLSNGVSRLASLESDRYAYWRVALKAFGHEPLYGVGAGGWSVWWLRYRTVGDFAQDAHSLPLQTAAELGVVGLVFLGMLVGGVAVAARRAHRLAPQMTTGALGAVVTYAAHAPLDWDWQMPALTLVALVLAGMLLGVSDRSAEAATEP
jgi:O-antigen ligase